MYIHSLQNDCEIYNGGHQRNKFVWKKNIECKGYISEKSGYFLELNIAKLVLIYHIIAVLLIILFVCLFLAWNQVWRPFETMPSSSEGCTRSWTECCWSEVSIFIFIDLFQEISHFYNHHFDIMIKFLLNCCYFNTTVLDILYLHAEL